MSHNLALLSTPKVILKVAVSWDVSSQKFNIRLFALHGSTWTLCWVTFSPSQHSTLAGTRKVSKWIRTSKLPEVPSAFPKANEDMFSTPISNTDSSPTPMFFLERAYFNLIGYEIANDLAGLCVNGLPKSLSEGANQASPLKCPRLLGVTWSNILPWKETGLVRDSPHAIAGIEYVTGSNRTVSLDGKESCTPSGKGNPPWLVITTSDTITRSLGS